MVSNKKNQALINQQYNQHFKDLQKQTLMKMKINKIEDDPISFNYFNRLKKSWIGNIYKKFLKPAPILRTIIYSLWLFLFPKFQKFLNIILCNLCNDKEFRSLPMKKLSEYVKANNLPKLNLFEKNKVKTPDPKVIPFEDQKKLLSPHNFYNFPPIYTAELSEAKVYGRTNLIFMKDTVICHDLFNFDEDYTSEELHGKQTLTKKNNHLILIKPDENPNYIQEAASFLDSCSENYAHWLTEVLPRIAIFCSIKKFKDIPILVDNDLHPNIMESLGLVAGSKRKIITLQDRKALKIKKLHVVSVTGYVPFEQRNKKILPRSHGIFSSIAFDILRKKIYQTYKANPKKNWPRKFFLKRTPTVRNIINSNEIEKLLIKNGYKIIKPEKLTFMQQFDLFMNADTIVGPTGAAFSNLIFAKPIPKFISLLVNLKQQVIGIGKI